MTNSGDVDGVTDTGTVGQFGGSVDNNGSNTPDGVPAIGDVGTDSDLGGVE